MSITIGKYSFEGPFTDTASLKNQSGVYVVLCQSGQSNHSKVVDVGESGDVRNRVENHDRKDCWRRNCTGTLAFAVYYCDAASRIRIESELRKQYNPPCGER